VSRVAAHAISLREALADPALLGNALAGPSWHTWRSLLLATMGERLTAGELAIFQRVTGRTLAPPSRVDEAAYVIGRRGGKDRAASVLATYLAALVDWSPVLVKGERGLVLCIGPDQRQAKITRDYIEGAFDASPVMASLVSNRTADSIELSNKISIEVRAASFRRLRGVTCVAVIATEAAFWQTDEGSGNPDSEILNAVRPSLATTHGPLIIITSPYARKGEVWDIYRRHYGPQGDPLILVAQGASRDFNPTLSESVVQRALERDYAAGSAEYLAQFRTDIESFVAREVVEAAVVSGRHELPPVSGTSYTAFCDPSGGSGDSFTLGIAHGGRDGRGVLDLVREVRPPFSPEHTVETFAAVLKSYGVLRIGGDRYAGEWPREQFRKHGITYEPSEKPKSDLYRELLPLLNSGRVELLDHPRLVAQLCGLERRTARGGRDSIDHSPGSRDDVANAIAGVLVLVSGEGSALWRRSELLVDASMPSRVDMVFGVLVGDKSGRAGVAFFSTSSLSRPGSAIRLLDCEQAPLSPSLLQYIVTRLSDLTELCSAHRGAVLFTTSELSETLERLGYHSEIIDCVLNDTMLPVSAAVHVSAQRVRVCADVLAKSYPLTFLQGAAVQDNDDPLRLAFLAGVAVALDANRKSGRAAA
jgi:hypothetical protein